jgi:alpha-glucosidase
MFKQSTTGTPIINPMFFMYPEDSKTFAIELQFFYGEHLLVSPITEENTTSVEIYLPNDLFYDFKTFASVQGQGAKVNLTDVSFTEIPLHIKSGSVIPMRNSSAYTTTDVRKQPFGFLVAPGVDGQAQGSLYLDDGDSIVQDSTSQIKMAYKDNTLDISGEFGYVAENNSLQDVTILGVKTAPQGAYWSKGTTQDGVVWYTCPEDGWNYDPEKQAVTIAVGQKLDRPIKVKFD